jgi:hypothetical protein
MTIFWIILPLITALFCLSTFLYIRARRGVMDGRTTIVISFVMGGLMGVIVSFLSMESFREFHF